MLPYFRYDLRGKAITAGIVGVMVSATTLMLPYLQATLRSNRIYILGIACLAVMACLMLRYTLTGFLLLGYVTASLFLSVSESMGSAMYQILCFSGLFLLASATYEHWKDSRGLIYNAVCLVALANVLVQLLQVFGVSFPRGLEPHAQYGYVGLLANVNETSALLAVCLPFFFRKRWRMAIPAIVAGLVMARTTNGILAAGIVSSVYFIAAYRRWAVSVLFYAVIIAGSILYIVSYDPIDIAKQMQGRGLIYKVTAQTAIVKPAGWGFGQLDYVVPLLTHTGTMRKAAPDTSAPYIAYLFQNVADKAALDRAVVKLSGEADPEKVKMWLNDERNNSPSMFIQAHNEYLEFWFAAGYAGLILMLAFLWRSLVRGFRKTDKIPAYALMASALTACLFFVWQIVPIAIMTVLCLALIWAKGNRT